MTETKSLPEVYRKAADLVLKHGKEEGNYGNKSCGFCTMGAVLYVAGHEEDGYPDLSITDERFGPLVKPLATQIVESGRAHAYDARRYETENEGLFKTVYGWNDGHSTDTEPTAEDVAALLRETADAVESGTDGNQSPQGADSTNGTTQNKEVSA